MIFTLKAKIIAGLVAGAILIGGVGYAGYSLHRSGYKAGVAAEAKKHQEAFDKAQADNEKATQELRTALNVYAEQYERLRGLRVQVETKIVRDLEERLVDHPTCEIDPDVIRLRNEVRAQ